VKGQLFEVRTECAELDHLAGVVAEPRAGEKDVFTTSAASSQARQNRRIEFGVKVFMTL
jgi:hypothetical protein